MILLIDNYDSFVHNLARYVGELGHAYEVVRNDTVMPSEIIEAAPEAVILSPGPRSPEHAGVCLEFLRLAPSDLPILGICLGHQCIGEAFGGRTTHAQYPVHGKAGEILHNGEGIFHGLPSPLTAAHYHSLVTELESDSPLHITASAPNGEIMALAHPSRPIIGLQFHPESVLTTHGHRLLQNFLSLTNSIDSPKTQRIAS